VVQVVRKVAAVELVDTEQALALLVEGHLPNLL
jgi:hypothetical protein